MYVKFVKRSKQLKIRCGTEVFLVDQRKFIVAVHAVFPIGEKGPDLFFLHAGLGDLIVYPISNSYQLVPLVL